MLIVLETVKFQPFQQNVHAKYQVKNSYHLFKFSLQLITSLSFKQRSLSFKDLIEISEQFVPTVEGFFWLVSCSKRSNSYWTLSFTNCQCFFSLVSETGWTRNACWLHLEFLQGLFRLWSHFITSKIFEFFFLCFKSNCWISFSMISWIFNAKVWVICQSGRLRQN